jgi:hypothetical protein
MSASGEPAWEVVAQAPPRDVFKELYGALFAARACVVDSRGWHRACGEHKAVERCDALLDRIDGVLADAGEVLS